MDHTSDNMRIDEMIRIFSENLIRQLTNLEQNISGINREISSIKSDLSEAQGDIKSIKIDLDHVNKSLDEIKEKTEKLGDCYSDMKVDIVKRGSMWGAVSGVSVMIVALLIALITGVFDKRTEKEVRYIWPEGFSPTRSTQYRDGGPVDTTKAYQMEEETLK